MGERGTEFGEQFALLSLGKCRQSVCPSADQPLVLRLGVVLFCLAAHSVRSGAQTNTGFDALSSPAQVMVCRTLPVTSADSAAFVYEFFDGALGSSDWRRSLIAYDSSGAPAYMTLFAPETDAKGKSRVHMLAVRFHPHAKGARIIVQRPDSLSGLAVPQAPREEALVDGELERTKAFAQLLWTRRCQAVIPLN